MKRKLATAVLATSLLFSGSVMNFAGTLPETQIEIQVRIPEWKANSTYAVGDQVVYGGNLYQCKVAHSRLKPTMKYVWINLGVYKATPDWVRGTHYAVGDQVFYKGHIYECIVDHVKLAPTVKYVWKFVK